MCERKDTVACTFDKESQKISAFDIYEWICEHLRLDEPEVTMIQIDGPHRQVFTKFTQTHTLWAIIDHTQGTAIYKHGAGVICVAGIAQSV